MRHNVQSASCETDCRFIGPENHKTTKVAVHNTTHCITPGSLRNQVISTGLYVLTL